MGHVLFWLLVSSAAFALADQGEQCPCDFSSSSTLNCASRNLTALVTLGPCGDGVSLDGFGNWTGHVLNASHNLLSEMADAETAPWVARVKVLDVSWNEFQTFDATAMKNLEELFVNDNHLETIQLPVSECKLERANVAANKLTKLPDELKNCSALSNFDASNNSIQHLPEDIVQILDTERRSENLTVDLRENSLSAADVASAIEAWTCVEVVFNASDCDCLSFRKQNRREKGVVLTLCLSDLCNRFTYNASTHCPTSVTPELEEVSTTTLQENISPSPAPGRAQSPPPPPVMMVTTSEAPLDTSTESPPASAPPSREERRRGRLALALILTAVALVLGCGLVGALVVLYRRRRREVRRETEAARLALKPLVSDTTPRFMRSTDNFTS